MGAALPASRTKQDKTVETRNNGKYSFRKYHRECSKHIIKEMRYRQSGSIQRKGTAPTSLVIKLVVASNAVDARVGKINQSAVILLGGVATFSPRSEVL